MMEPEQHDAHVRTYEREMDWQYVLSNGGSVVAECGTRLGGDDDNET